MPSLNVDNLVKENVIDRIVRYLDPVKAERRFKARAMLALSGSYIGASRSKRSLSQWRTSWGDAVSDTLFDLPVLRDRSRDLIRNAPLATGAVNTVCTNVVGTGLKLQSRIDREALGMEEDEADQGLLEETLEAQVGALEKRLIIAALEATGRNQSQTAKRLGVSRAGLLKKMKRLKIS